MVSKPSSVFRSQLGSARFFWKVQVVSAAVDEVQTAQRQATLFIECQVQSHSESCYAELWKLFTELFRSKRKKRDGGSPCRAH